MKKKMTGMMALAMTLIAVPAIILFTTMSAMADDASDFVEYEDKAGRVILLSNENRQPFLFYGKPLSTTEKYAKLYDKYKSSLKKFPSVRDCLLKEERDKAQPDLTKFDWRKIDWNEDAEVCLFRIATSYADLENMKRWFESQGFEKVKISNPFNESWKVETGWDVKEYGVLFSHNFLLRQWQNLIVYGMSFGISYDENYKIQGVGVGSTIE